MLGDIIFCKVKDVKSPTRGTNKSAGIDFYVPNYDFPLVVKPHERVLIPSGIKVILQPGTCMIMHNKSGVASKTGLDVMACVIDEDYRGEIFINFVNTSADEVLIQPGTKIVQGIVTDVSYCGIDQIDSEKYLKYEKTEREDGGFGSTGDE